MAGEVSSETRAIYQLVRMGIAFVSLRVGREVEREREKVQTSSRQIWL